MVKAERKVEEKEEREAEQRWGLTRIETSRAAAVSPGCQHSLLRNFSGTDARDLPCAWKTGSGGKCCWLLLPTTVRLGFRAAGEQEGCLARTKEVNYYLPGTHRVWNLLSAIDALVQGKGM